MTHGVMLGVRSPDLHSAAKRGDVERVRRLLAAAPDPAQRAALAASTDQVGRTAAHFAIAGREAGCLEALGVLLDANPGLATAAVANGSTPLHSAASRSNIEAVRLLLATAPSPALLAAAADSTGVLPLHYAASAGRDDTVRLLLQVAPKTAAAANHKGQSSLDLALWSAARGRTHEGHLRSARLLIAAPGQQAVPLLRTLNCAGPAALSLYTDVATHHSFAANEWQLTPSPCPGLAAALPAALQRSPAEAALLVARLPDVERWRLRTAALALHHAQKAADLSLPQPLVWRIVAAAMA